MTVEAAPAHSTAGAQVLTDDGLALAHERPEFLTLPAYELLTDGGE